MKLQIPKDKIQWFSQDYRTTVASDYHHDLERGEPVPQKSDST